MRLPCNQLAAFFRRSSHRLGSVHFHHSFQLIHTSVLQLQLLESYVWLCVTEEWFLHNDSNNSTASRCGLRSMRWVANSYTALVRSVSGLTVSVLEGHSIGHCERKVHTNICLILFTEIGLYGSTITHAFWMAIKKKKLLTVNLILSLIYCLDDKFVTQKWQICYSSQ